MRLRFRSPVLFIPKGSSVPPEWFASVYNEEEPENLEMVEVLAVCSVEKTDSRGVLRGNIWIS
jgi:hypothetical protein